MVKDLGQAQKGNSYIYKKRKIIPTIAAFIGGGFAVVEFVLHVLVNHYHFPKQWIDITIVTLLCALICTMIWRFFGGTEKKARKIKLEFILIPIIILITVFFDIRLIQQIGEPGAETISELKWKNSIAVLPFMDFSRQKDQGYFCDGMTEEIIARISKLEELKVISTTSVMCYKNKDKDIKEIGQELNVSTILEGSVRKEKDDIRVTAQLINIEDGFHLWSDTYHRKLESAFFTSKMKFLKRLSTRLRSSLWVKRKNSLSSTTPRTWKLITCMCRGDFSGTREHVQAFRKPSSTSSRQ